MIRTVSAALPRIALFLLALVPVVTVFFILQSMASGALNPLTEPADLARRASYPWAVIGHMLGGSAILMLGLAQFSTRLRRAAPRLHRWNGRALVAAGCWIALSALWMNASPKALPDTFLHEAAQDVVAVVFLAVLALGVYAIRTGHIATHRAWMMRAYAITLGAATQTVMLLPVFLIFGPPIGLIADLVFISGWLINLAVAEVLIRRGQLAPRRNGSISTAPNRS